MHDAWRNAITPAGPTDLVFAPASAGPTDLVFEPASAGERFSAKFVDVVLTGFVAIALLGGASFWADSNACGFKPFDIVPAVFVIAHFAVSIFNCGANGSFGKRGSEILFFDKSSGLPNGSQLIVRWFIQNATLYVWLISWQLQILTLIPSQQRIFRLVLLQQVVNAITILIAGFTAHDRLSGIRVGRLQVRSPDDKRHGFEVISAGRAVLPVEAVFDGPGIVASETAMASRPSPRGGG